jgi:alkylation response protein AidB-like acyl-CoA dehydrogenase
MDAGAQSVPGTDILAAIAVLTPTIRARAGEIEAARRLPADLAQSLAKAGVFRVAIPKGIGGLELEPRVIFAALETLGQADASVGWCAMIAATTGVTAAYLATDVAREIYGRPDVITGGVYAPIGKAVADGDHYVVTGRWPWSSGSANCHWLGGGSVIVEGGVPRMLPSGGPDARMMLFPAKDAALIDTWHVAGLCGTGSGEMAVEGLRVPKSRSISLVTDKPVADGALYAFPVFGLLALGIASVMLGNGRAAIDDLVALAVAKTPQSSRRTLAERPAAQAAVADADAKLRGARAFFYEAVEQAWAKARGDGEIALAERAALRLAATHATRTAADVARAMYDLGGGSSLFLASPLQRRFRDAHAGTQHMMVAPPTYELTGRVLLNIPTDARQL